MWPWLYLLGGPLIWAAHFAGAYAIASLADVTSRADAPWALATVGCLTLVCAGLDVALFAWTLRRPAPVPTDAALAGFWRSTAGLGALVSLIAVLWQGLPILLGH